MQSDGSRVVHCGQTNLTLRLFHLLQSDGSAGLPGPLLGGVQHNMLSDPVLCRFFLKNVTLTVLISHYILSHHQRLRIAFNPHIHFFPIFLT